MYRFLDWFARNRAKIGSILGVIYAGVSQIDPQLWTDFPRLMAYVGLGLGLVFGGGAFKSDSYQRNKRWVSDAVAA